MATTDITKGFQLPSSFSTLSALGKGRVGLGLGSGFGGSGGLFMSADDHRLSQQVQEKHSPDGRHVDVRPLLHLVEDIFARANQSVDLEIQSRTKAGATGNAGAAATGGTSGGVAGNLGGSVGGGLGVGGGVGGGIGGQVGIGGGVGGNLGGAIGGSIGGAVGGGIGANVGGGVGGAIGGGIGASVGRGIGGSIGGGVGVNVGGGICGGIGAGVEAGAAAKGDGRVGGSVEGGIGVGGGLGVGGGINGSLGVGGLASVGGGASIGIDGGFDVKGDIAASFDGSPDLPLMIERVSCEMGCKCLGGANAHEATFSVLETLAHYSWEAKMVITLAAFAANYGEFLLLSQVYSTNPLAQSMALLKQLPSILHHADEKTKRQMDAIKGLINAMLSVTKLVVEFNELPAEYVKPEEPAVKVVHSHFPLAVYWTIRSAVAAATHISLIATMGHEFMPSTTELDLSSWSGKLNFVFDFLKKMKISVQKIIDEKQEEEAYNKIRKIIFKMVHQDNMTVLRTLIYNKDDVLPLFDGSTKKRVQLDVLQGKTVLLLLTSLEISQDELTMLENIYNESKTRPYDIVWVPVVDRSMTWNDSLQSQFESTQNTMPWYSVYHPSIVGSAVIRFFSKDLSFRGKPILVPIDTQGKITSTNALHMMWIWKNDAFPFTNVREESLWMHETWRLELLVDNTHPSALKWAKEDKYTFVYGSEDIDWIRKFTKLAKEVAAAAKINLDMVYVGKSCKRETVRKITNTIELEKLSDNLKDVTSTWFFWTRLESMLQSLIQLEKVNDDNNKVIQEIKKLCSYDKNGGGWTVLAKGSELVVSVQGMTIVEVLSKFDEWKERVDKLGGAFHLALEEVIKAEGLEHTCFRFEFPTTGGKIPQEMKCPDCHNQMQNYVTFVCCHEGGLSAVAKHESAKSTAAPAT